MREAASRTSQLGSQRISEKSSLDTIQGGCYKKTITAPGSFGERAQGRSERDGPCIFGRAS